MATYQGRTWTQAELRERVGHMRQIAGIQALEATDGQGRGSRVLHVYNGSGLTFDVSPERALDVTAIHYRGMALAWSSAAGLVHPAYYEAGGLGWLRSFGGGLFTTCGLDQFGSPAEDGGESFGIHGRVGNLPAEQVATTESWHHDDYRLTIHGQVRQSRLFGENLVLRRSIWTELGESSLYVEDSVTNEGFTSQPHMVLYHCNLGFPLLDADSQLAINASETVARDAVAEAGLAEWGRFQPPTAGYAEQVFRHLVTPDADSMASATLHNPALNLGLTIRYSHDTLPHLFQWKQMGQGAYVLGLEPANSSAIEGRAVARQRDDLPYLEPGETRRYLLHFEITSDHDSPGASSG